MNIVLARGALPGPALYSFAGVSLCFRWVLSYGQSGLLRLHGITLYPAGPANRTKTAGLRQCRCFRQALPGKGSGGVPPVQLIHQCIQ
jgi:hypothetical protein